MMTAIAFMQPRRRNAIRRNEDLALRRQMDRYEQLFHIGHVITSEFNFDTVFDVIAGQTIQIMDAERCSVFLADEKGRELTAFVSTDLKKKETKIPRDFGIAGWVYCNKLPLNVPDAYEDSRFYPGIDQLTGFKTKNILCVPLINRKKECIGTLQALNKKSGDFTDCDRELFGYLANYITVAIENAKLYEELKTTDEAKKRVIHHLSHELKTPLAIIASAFDIIEKRTGSSDHLGLKKAAQRGQRSVVRLMDLQEKVGDIMQLLPVEKETRVVSLIKDTIDILEEVDEGCRNEHEDIFDLAKNRIESIFTVQDPRIECLMIADVLSEILRDKPPSSRRNYPEIVTKIEKDLIVSTDRKVIKKVLEGLLKNAVENTPDEGRIEITAAKCKHEIRIDFRDYGIGISTKNQKNIFSGFYHTHETNSYSSKRPYEFNAGGAGLDLLRMKAFSEIFGFSVHFESRRCKYLPTDADICIGKVSACPHIKDKANCLSSGGSMFTVKFKNGLHHGK